MLVHRITLLLHEGLNPTKEFGRKTSERDLAEKMEVKFELIKKLHGYSITSINNPTVKISMQILDGKVMRKCHTDELLEPIISLASQSAEGMQFNWSRYLCSEFLADFHEAQDERKTFHYAWFLLSILLVARELPEDNQFPNIEHDFPEAMRYSSLWDTKDVKRIH